MEASERKKIVLGGRAFHVIDFKRRTVDQDLYMMREIRKSGVDKVMPMDGEEDVQFLVRAQTLLIDSGRAVQIIAAFLLPEGCVERDWTVKMAEQTVQHIQKLDTEEDREQVLTLAMEAVFGFFAHGARRLLHFASVLQAEPPKSQIASAIATTTH